jgi:hypothetical protein
MTGPIADALLNERKEANYWRRAWQTAHTAADEHYRRAEHLQMKLDEARAQLEYWQQRNGGQ